MSLWKGPVTARRYTIEDCTDIVLARTYGHVHPRAYALTQEAEIQLALDLLRPLRLEVDGNTVRGLVGFRLTLDTDMVLFDADYRLAFANVTVPEAERLCFARSMVYFAWPSFTLHARSAITMMGLTPPHLPPVLPFELIHGIPSGDIVYGTSEEVSAQIRALRQVEAARDLREAATHLPKDEV